MSLFKLETGQSLPAGKNEGFCITESSQGTSARKSPAQFPHFSQRQKASSQKLMIGVRGWRNLSPAGVAAWVAWVAYLPQPSERNPLRYLSAFQNFIKINAFRAIFYDDPMHKFENPELTTLVNDKFVSSVRADESQVFLDIDFVRNNADLCLTFQFSMPVSQGLIYPSVNQVICLNCFNESGVYDITALFLSKYGLLPVTGDNVIMSWQTFGRNNGQYFFKQSLPIVVIPVNPPIVFSNYGYLYKGYIVDDIRQFAPVGWSFPTLTQIDALRAFLDPSGTISSNVAGRHMKIAGSDYWVVGNDADNSSDFSAKGSGTIDASGVYQSFQQQVVFWGLTPVGTGRRSISLTTSAVMARPIFQVNTGACIRLIKNDSTDPGQMVGNDGQVYNTVKLGGQVWMKEASKETMFRDGSPIPLVINASEFAASLVSCRAAPNYNPALV